MSSLTLCTIARDEEENLAACLNSAAGIVHQILVADTGSLDDTVSVARRFGARVVSIPWEQDFARARNRALEYVDTDWVLVLDADEMLDPGAATRIDRLLAKPDADGYQVTIRNYVEDRNARVWDRVAKPNDFLLEAARPYPAYVEHENVRLFRCHPDIRFVGAVHESVGPRMIENGRKLGRANFAIHHFGLVADEQKRLHKRHFYRELGVRKIREMPDNAQAYFELGLLELDSFRNTSEALRYFQTACRLERDLPVAWFFAGLTLSRLARDIEAIPCFQRAEQRGYRTPQLLEALADAHYNAGQYDLACARYTDACRQTPDGSQLESKLGLAELRAGRTADGLAHLYHAIERTPSDSTLYDRAVTACVWLGLLDQAASLLAARITAIGADPDSIGRLASIRTQQGRREEAIRRLRDGVVQFPESAKLRAFLSELDDRAQGAFVQGGIHETEPVSSPADM